MKIKIWFAKSIKQCSLCAYASIVCLLSLSLAFEKRLTLNGMSSHDSIKKYYLLLPSKLDIYSCDRNTIVWTLWRHQQSLWCHQKHVNWASVTRGRCVWRPSFLSSLVYSLCRLRNKIVYALSWRTVYVITWVLSWCFALVALLHQNNSLLSA